MAELLLIGVGQMGRPYLAAAGRLGLSVRVVENLTRFDAAGLDSVRPCRGDLDELWAEAAWAAAAERRPDGILAFSEPQVLAAALTQDTLRLPGPSLHAAVMSRNKALQRGRFAADGIGQPDYVVAKGLDAVEDWAAARLPVVIKPLSLAGSAGVELVADIASYRAAVARRPGEGPLLVETAVDGPEYSWEALVRDGGIWYSNTTAKETTGPPHFVEVSHQVGVQLDAKAAAQVESLAHSVLAALQMRTGLVHLEFRLAESGPEVMEVAVRTPGDFLMDVLSLAHGFDWFEMAVRLSLSLPMPPPPPGPVRCAASYLPVAAPGTVTEVAGVEAVRAHRCVQRAEVTVRPGDVLTAARSSAQRVGYAVLAADSRDELESALDYVRHAMVVRTTPDRAAC